jgi:hypothetical protein
LTKFGNADEDLFDKVRNAEAGERVPMTNGECAEADVNFADNEGNMLFDERRKCRWGIFD